MEPNYPAGLQKQEEEIEKHNNDLNQQIEEARNKTYTDQYTMSLGERQRTHPQQLHRCVECRTENPAHRKPTPQSRRPSPHRRTKRQRTMGSPRRRTYALHGSRITRATAQ